MSEIHRPGWCAHPDCHCLTGYDGRVCVGRLPRMRPHDDLFNTHRLCLEDVDLEINDGDAFYFIRCMQVVRQDVAAHGLWCEGKGERYDFGAQPGR